MLTKREMMGVHGSERGLVNKRGVIEHADKFGTDIAIRPKTAPALAEYEDYCTKTNYRRNSNSRMTASRLRRIVIMRQQGCTWKDCGDAVGVRGSTAQEWCEFLPMELQP